MIHLLVSTVQGSMANTNSHQQKYLGGSSCIVIMTHIKGLVVDSNKQFVLKENVLRLVVKQG